MKNKQNILNVDSPKKATHIQELGKASELTFGSPFGRLLEGFRPQQGFFKPS